MGFAMKRIITFILGFVFLFSLLCAPSFAEPQDSDSGQQPLQKPDIQSGAAIVMDADSGAILYQKSENEKFSPADTVQILTVLLGIESGKASETVTVSKDIVGEIDREGTHISLSADEEVKMSDLFYASLLASAADAAKTIAAAVSGSEETFVQAMNQRMERVGATNTSFTNPDGAYAENNFTTAKDLALLALEALKNKTFREIFGTASYTMDATNKNASGRSFSTLCLLMKNSEMDVKYEYAVGGKTGWNGNAGYNLVSAAKKDGKTLICVILNAENSKQRYEETIALFDYAFSEFQNVSIPPSLLAPTEIPVMKDGTIIRKIHVEIPEGTVLSTNVDFQEGTMSVSELPKFVTEGDTNLTLTVSAKDLNNNVVEIGTISLKIETEEIQLEQSPGGNKPVPLSFGAKLWNVIKTILIILLYVVLGIILIAAGLFLISYLQRRQRQKNRRRKLEEQKLELETDAEEQLPTGRRHKK